MKLNNRGMTIVEMIVAFAILGLVSTSIFSMMLTGTKTYTKLTNTVKLQYEAQLVTAHIEKRVLNCNKVISWEADKLVLVEEEKVHIYCRRDNRLYYGVGTVDGGEVDMYLLTDYMDTSAPSFVVTGVPEEGEDCKQVQYKIVLSHNNKTCQSEKRLALRSVPVVQDVHVELRGIY